MRIQRHERPNETATEHRITKALLSVKMEAFFVMKVKASMGSGKTVAAVVLCLKIRRADASK